MSTTRIEVTTKVVVNKPFLVKPQATFLMCPPTLYDVDYVINPWMAGNVHASSRTRAAEQWQRLYEAVSKIANVELIEPEPGSPDMVFTANAGLERNGIVAISSFYHPERQGEEPQFRRWFQQAGYTIVDIPRATPFEGEGDALFSTDGRCLWAGYGPRTAAASHRALRDTFGTPVVPLHLIDPRFYHLDTCFAPLDGGYIMYLPDAFDHLSLHRIEAFYSPVETNRHPRSRCRQLCLQRHQRRPHHHPQPDQQQAEHPTRTTRLQSHSGRTHRVPQSRRRSKMPRDETKQTHQLK